MKIKWIHLKCSASLVGSRSIALVPAALIVAGVAGSIAGLVLMVRHRRWHVTLPFGPCLVAGAVVALLLSAT